MHTHTATPGAGAAPAALDAFSESDTLRSAIVEIEGLADTSFSKIEAAAQLTLLALQQPEAYRHPEWLAQALLTILHTAQESRELITGVAERRGCRGNWERDQAQQARRTAACIATGGATPGAVAGLAPAGATA